MTPSEYRAILSRLGLSQVGAARLFEADPRTSRRWAEGTPIPPSVAKLLRLMDSGAVTVDQVRSA